MLLLLDHDGPKGQIHLAGRDKPLWFSSVRDTLAFMRLPEEPRNIAAVYVNDMGRATDWQQPEPGTWVALEEAFLVIESRMAGGLFVRSQLVTPSEVVPNVSLRPVAEAVLESADTGKTVTVAELRQSG